MEKKLKRSFGGKLGNFVMGGEFSTKDERRMQKKHLSAYLRGALIFRHGYTIKGEPNWLRVQELWT
jgi:hypothetical protein